MRADLTVSTSGIVPHIEKLGDECNVSLAVSLHAPNDELRNRIVPINKLHPIDELLEACWRYAAKRANRFITFEYVMLRNVNDSLAHADELADLLRVERKTVYSAIRRGEIPGVQRVGRTIRIGRAAVVSWLNSGQGCVSRSKRRSR